MNNKTLTTTYLGRELPKDYINCIENGESFPEWLTLYPDTEYEHSTEIEVWSKEDLFSHTYSESFCNYAIFACDDVAFSVLQTRDEDTLTPEELQSAFAIGAVNEGFVFINLHDDSLWISCVFWPLAMMRFAGMRIIHSLLIATKTIRSFTPIYNTKSGYKILSIPLSLR